MSEPTASMEGDFVVVAQSQSPTEAHVLRGVLEAAGLNPFVRDANLAQANPWIATALGGVRVVVPAAQVDAAHQALADYRAGALDLPGEDALPQRQFEALPAPIYSPDIATLLSFVLVTPAFGAGVNLLNAKTIEGRASASGWAWFGALVLASLFVLMLPPLGTAAPVSAPLGAMGLSLLTALWYYAEGGRRNQAVLDRFGRAYPRKSVIPLALGVLALQGLLRWAVVTAMD